MNLYERENSEEWMINNVTGKERTLRRGTGNGWSEWMRTREEEGYRRHGKGRNGPIHCVRVPGRKLVQEEKNGDNF